MGAENNGNIELDSILYCHQVAPVFLEYEEKLKSFIRKRVADEDDRKDLLQQVLLKLYRHCEKLPEVKNMQAWLYQVTRNTLTDYFKEGMRFTNNLQAEGTPDCGCGKVGAPRMVQHTEVPDEEIKKEFLEYLRPMISLLPEKYGQPLIMSDLEGIPQQEIANRLGMSLSGAKSRVQRAREKLRELMMQCFILEFSKNGGILNFEVKDNCGSLVQVKEELEKKRS